MASSPEHLSITYDTYLKIQIALDVMAAAFVATRLLANYRTIGKLAADDYFSAVAVAVLTGYSSSSFIMTRAFTSPDTTIPSITRISVICLFTGGAAMYFAKVPLLLFYIRIFSIKKWLRITCYVVLAATAVVYLVCAIYSGANCIPGNGIYDVPFQLQCEARTLIPALCRCFTSIFTDVVALSLPLAVVTRLHLPRTRKIGLALVFMTGIFAIIAGCVSLYYQWRMAKSSSYQDMTVAMLCTCIDCSIAIIVSCAPALHSLWSNYISKSHLVKSLHSYSARKRDKSNPSQQIEVTTHRYIEIDNSNKALPEYQANVVGGEGY